MKFLILVALMTSMAFAEDTCETIRTSKNSPEKSINIVLVPSGFGDNTEEFGTTVKELWKEVEKYDPYSPEVTTLNVIVAKVSYEKEYCEFLKSNDRVLECDFLKASRLASRCMDGPNRFVISIHNSTRHGGSGARFGASATLAKSSTAIIAHELGHSIFGLADEYVEDGLNIGKNCSNSSTCSSWKDLIDAGLAECKPGCEGNTKFTSPTTLMASLAQQSFGHVNNRLICCKFEKMTGSYPSFCSPYETVGEGLDKFCK